MKQSVLQMMVLTALSWFLWMVLLGTPAWAETDINEAIPEPPPIVIESSPTMVYLAEPSIYVAIGIPYHLYFYHDRYYYYHLGFWYRAPGFHGPWVHMRFKTLPPGFRKFKLNQLHKFRDREFRLYKTQGQNYKGRTFIAVHPPKAKPPFNKRPKNRGKFKRR